MPYTSYLFLSLFGSLFVYTLFVIGYFLKNRKIKFNNFGFSLINYYILVSGYLIGIFLLSLIERNLFYLSLFVFFAVAGVLGEMFFSWLWKLYFKKPFWKYNSQLIANGYSSWLNFIPWGSAGFLFLAITEIYYGDVFLIFKNDTGREMAFIVMFQMALVFFLQFLIFKIVSRTNFKMSKKIKYIYFISPFFILGLFVPIDYFNYTALFFLYGVLAFVSEYIFGKISRIVINKKLWNYNYATLDQGQTTLLNIIPFGVAGYFFLFAFKVLVG